MHITYSFCLKKLPFYEHCYSKNYYLYMVVLDVTIPNLHISDNWKPRRFRHFYLDVSNSSVTETTKEMRIRCYTDNTTEPATPPSKLTMPCNQIARYVIVETTYDAPDDEQVTGPILEICEIEVYGK